MAFGETIRKLRTARSWTLQELGQATEPKMSAGAVGSVESGRNDNPTDKMVRRFAKAFNMTVAQLRRESGLDGGDDTPNIEDLNTEEELHPLIVSVARRWGKYLDDAAWNRVAGFLQGVAEEERAKRGTIDQPNQADDDTLNQPGPDDRRSA